MHYKIYRDSSFSDHHPITLLINLSSSPPCGSSWKVSARFCKKPKTLLRPYGRHLLFKFLSLQYLGNLLNIIKKLSISRLVADKVEEARLRGSLKICQVQPHLDPQSKIAKSIIKDRRSQLQKFMDRKEDGHRIRSRMKWMKSRDRMNKYLFSSVKGHPIGGLIMELYDEDDTFVSSSANLGQVSKCFILSCTLVPLLMHKERIVVRSC